MQPNWWFLASTRDHGEQRYHSSNQMLSRKVEHHLLCSLVVTLSISEDVIKEIEEVPRVSFASEVKSVRWSFHR